MMMWKEVYHNEVAEYKGTMCYRSHKHIYTFPAGSGDKRAAIETMMGLAEKSGQVFTLRGFDKEGAEWLEEQFPGVFEISTSRDEWDYVYSVEALSTLAGPKYHGKRNHIARFKDGGD